jgi:hypothetical protein
MSLVSARCLDSTMSCYAGSSDIDNKIISHSVYLRNVAGLIFVRVDVCAVLGINLQHQSSSLLAKPLLS